MDEKERAMGEITLFGVGVIALVVALVEAAKVQFGLPVSWAPYMALILSVGFVGAAELLAAFPWLAPYFRAVVQALGVFLAATGGYHVYKEWRQKRGA